METRRSKKRLTMVRAGAIAGLAVALLTPSSAAAWDQQKPPPGQDYTGCLNTSTSPCIEWPKTAQNLSINVDVYLAASLSAGSDLNLKTDVRNTFPKWNEVAARNPHLQETTSTSNEEIWVARANLENDPSIAGFANLSNIGSAPNYRIQSVVVYFNTLTTYNRNMDFGCSGVGTGAVCWADARYVSVHEFGHAEALVHVHLNDPFASVMRNNFSYTPHGWWPAVDDHNGIIGIYGAYP